MPPLRKNKSEARFKRRVTKVLPVDCMVVTLPLNRMAPHHLGPGDVFGGRTINISKTGLQIHSDYELDPKTVVDITVSLDKPPRKVTLRTEVAWARRNAFDIYGRWGMGLHITESRPGELARLNAFYDSLV